MTTTSIKEELEFLFGKTECSQKELEQITSLTISRMNDFGDEIYDVDLSDLSLFPNLKSLFFRLMIIDSDVVKAMGRCGIEAIYLKKCQLTDDVAQALTNMNLKLICLDNTKFKREIIESVEAEELIIIGSVVNKTFSPCAKKVDISRSDIEEYVLNENNEKIVISQKQYDKNKKYWEESKKEVIIMEDNGQYEYKRLGVNYG